MSTFLSDRQSQTIAAALTVLAGVVLLLSVAGLTWVLAAFVGTFSSVLLPLAVAAVAALVVRPFYDKLADSAGLPPAAALVVVFVSLLLPIAVFAGIFGRILVAQAIEAAAHAPEWIERSRGWIEAAIPQLADLLERTGLDERLRTAAEEQQSALLSGLQAFGAQAVSAGFGIVRWAGALLGWAVVPVYFAFFLMMRGTPVNTAELLPFLKEDTRDDVAYLVREFVDIVVAFFRGQLLVALCMGILYSAGLSLVGLHYGFLLGLLLGLLSIIPYLGTMVGLAIALPVGLLQEGGGLALCALVLGVIALVQTIEGWLLTPKIMGDRTGLHPMAVMIAIFFWGTALDGIIGMIVAIPLTAFLASLWRLARDKYIPEIV